MSFAGTDIDFNGNTNVQLDDNGGLFIKSVAVDNGGWYTCIASNNVGKDEAKALVFVAGMDLGLDLSGWVGRWSPWPVVCL